MLRGRSERELHRVSVLVRLLSCRTSPRRYCAFFLWKRWRGWQSWRRARFEREFVSGNVDALLKGESGNTKAMAIAKGMGVAIVGANVIFAVCLKELFFRF